MIEIRIDQEALKELNKKFEKLSSESPGEAKKAVNETAREAKKILAAGAKAKYTLKRSNFSGEMKLQSATVGRIEAIIRSTGEPIPLIQFKVSKGKRATKAQVLKKGSPKELKKASGDIKAFVNNIANRNQIRKKDTDKGKAGSRVIHVGVAQRKGKERLTINELYGSSVPKMLEKTFDEKKSLIVEALKSNLDKHIETTMRG